MFFLLRRKFKKPAPINSFRIVSDENKGSKSTNLTDIL